MTVPGKGGQPSFEQKLIPSDYDKIYNLGRIKASSETIAAFFDVPHETIERMMKPRKDPNGNILYDEDGNQIYTKFCHFYKKGLANLREALHLKQIQKAGINLENPLDNTNPGDTTMQIWLGKNILGQVDRQDFTFDRLADAEKCTFNW
jgi:hypothetical protein